MVVIPARNVAPWPCAQASASPAPRAKCPATATSLGMARYGAPSLDITIAINSTVVFLNWLLVMLAGRAAVLGGRRCFFNVVLLLTDLVEMMTMLVMDLLLSRFPSASYHHGRQWPLGGTSLSTRTVTWLVGRTPLSGGR